MTFVFIWETCLCGFRLFWVDCDTSNEVSISVGGTWYVLPPGSEDGLFRIVGTENNG